MRKIGLSLAITLLICSFVPRPGNTTYYDYYFTVLGNFEHSQDSLLRFINRVDISNAQGVTELKGEIEKARLKLKAADLWLRYFEPTAYKKINGPLPVEWENEVFEKFEKPYKREGAGLALAEIYLGSEKPTRDSVAHLIRLSARALNTYHADSITDQLKTFDHFYFCNRLYLLNLAAIYTTGFECPGKQNVIPELRAMLASVKDIYLAYNRTFSATPLYKRIPGSLRPCHCICRCPACGCKYIRPFHVPEKLCEPAFCHQPATDTAVQCALHKLQRLHFKQLVQFHL